ncbi:MAG: hypothetical protein BWX79_02751 [Alphaproteobacteria bacterium ADurb.Bin100]|nr:MAG: hypothetical protein BWX79_02751 [Alphaproteobacteria bacterium ADurb.Bin100]
MAGLVGVFAGLVARDEFQHAQRRLGQARAQALQCVQRELAPGRLGGQIEHLVQPAAGAAGIRRHGAQQREQRAHGLTDAGRRLRHQAATRAGGAVHRLGQFALAGAKGRHRKGQRAQRLVPGRPVGGLLRRPGGKVPALLLEKGLQRCGLARLRENGLLACVDVVVDQRQRHLLQAQLVADQRAVDTGLRPVQLAVVVRHMGQVATVGLDFFQAPGHGVPAVGAAPHAQRPPVPRQRHLGLVAHATPGGDHSVAFDAFGPGGRRGEAQVQVATLGGEFAQGAHRHGVDGRRRHQRRLALCARGIRGLSHRLRAAGVRRSDRPAAPDRRRRRRAACAWPAPARPQTAAAPPAGAARGAPH